MHQVEFIVFSARALKGTELLQKLKEIQPKIVKIIITGHPSIENAAKSVNEKADGYVLKPFNVAELLEMIKKTPCRKGERVFPDVYRGRTRKKEYASFQVSTPKQMVAR